MADFKGASRIRRWMTGLVQQVRRVRLPNVRILRQRSLRRVNPKTGGHSSGPFLRYYRTPILATVAAVAAVAGTFLAAQQYVADHTRTFYSVMMNGQPVGTVSSRELVENLIEQKKRELAESDTEVRYALRTPEVTYTIEKAYKAEPDDEGTLQRVAANLETYPIGVKLVVDGKTVGYVRDEETARELLDRIKERYAGDLDARSNQPEVMALSYGAAKDAKAKQPGRTLESVRFLEAVATVTTEISPDQLSDPDKLYKKLVTGNPTPVKYTVQKGDSVSYIAQKFDVPREVIYRNNPWIEDDLIRVGDVLDLTQEKPLLNVEVVEQVTQLETIEPKIEYRTSDDMKVGQKKVISKGKPGRQLVTYRLIKRNGDLVEEERVDVQILEPSKPTIILKGTKVVRGEGTGRFAMPVLNYRITSYYGKRWGRLHKGIDIIGNSRIMASDNGVVEFAGKKNGLGNAIIINHRNGYKTVYGHLSKINVKKGQVVEKGEVIGIMGNTGNSTGTHLHFEVHVNGSPKNPLNYL